MNNAVERKGTPEQRLQRWVQHWHGGVPHSGDHVIPARDCLVCMRSLALALIRELAIVQGIPLERIDPEAKGELGHQE